MARVDQLDVVVRGSEHVLLNSNLQLTPTISLWLPTTLYCSHCAGCRQKHRPSFWVIEAGEHVCQESADDEDSLKDLVNDLNAKK